MSSIPGQLTNVRQFNGDQGGKAQVALLGGRASLALLLAVLGLSGLTFEIFLAHPETVHFSTQGRVVIGEVLHSAPPGARDGSRYFRNRSTIGAADSELGPQVMRVYGDLPVGQKVPVLCLTAVGHCMSADVVKERLDMWPLTPVTLCGSISLALAVLMLGLGVRRKRQHVSRRDRAGTPTISG